jgi:hypothetical protein
MAHELLRQAALILAAGWSKGADARDAAGRIVPLHVGAARATINPEAVAFSPYGAICKAAAESRSQLPRAMWDKLAELAAKRIGGGSHSVGASGREKEETYHPSSWRDGFYDRSACDSANRRPATRSGQTR